MASVDVGEEGRDAARIQEVDGLVDEKHLVQDQLFPQGDLVRVAVRLHALCEATAALCGDVHHRTATRGVPEPLPAGRDVDSPREREEAFARSGWAIEDRQ